MSAALRMMTLRQVAEALAVSYSTVCDWALASEYAAEIKAGKREIEDVPPRLVPHLKRGFPRPKKLGKRLRRIDESAVKAWLTR